MSNNTEKQFSFRNCFREAVHVQLWDREKKIQVEVSIFLRENSFSFSFFKNWRFLKHFHLALERLFSFFLVFLEFVDNFIEMKEHFHILHSI